MQRALNMVMLLADARDTLNLWFAQTVVNYYERPAYHQQGVSDFSDKETGTAVMIISCA